MLCRSGGRRINYVMSRFKALQNELSEVQEKTEEVGGSGNNEELISYWKKIILYVYIVFILSNTGRAS